MVTCHSKTLLSSTSPAENPSTGFFARSATINKQDARDQEPIAVNRGDKGGENRDAFGSVPLSCFWSRRLAWLTVPAMARKQRSSIGIGSGLGFWRWGVVRRPTGGAALFLGARAALESGGRGENGTGWTIYKKLERESSKLVWLIMTTGLISAANHHVFYVAITDSLVKRLPLLAINCRFFGTPRANKSGLCGVLRV